MYSTVHLLCDTQGMQKQVKKPFLSRSETSMTRTTQPVFLCVFCLFLLRPVCATALMCPKISQGRYPKLHFLFLPFSLYHLRIFSFSMQLLHSCQNLCPKKESSSSLLLLPLSLVVAVLSRGHDKTTTACNFLFSPFSLFHSSAESGRTREAS